MNSTTVAIGEILWDLFPDGARLGGATFNFCGHLRRLGAEVHFISAVGDDRLGERALARARKLQVQTTLIQTVDHPTGIVSVTLDRAGHPSFRLERPAAYDRISLDDAGVADLSRIEPGWIYYGTLHQIVPEMRRLTGRLLEALAHAVRFYDVNLRPGCYTAELVESLLWEADVIKLSAEEAIEIDRMLGDHTSTIAAFCDRTSRRFEARAVCVTSGDRGCSLWHMGAFTEAPGYPVQVSDTVGSGDAFAAGLLWGLAHGWEVRRTADFANKLGALIASKPGGVPAWSLEELEHLPLRQS
jgi:fructokinase